MFLKPNVKILSGPISGSVVLEGEVEELCGLLKKNDDVERASMQLTWLATRGYVICVVEWCTRENN